jgi:hypothetical protein
MPCNMPMETKNTLKMGGHTGGKIINFSVTLVKRDINMKVTPVVDIDEAQSLPPV